VRRQQTADTRERIVSAGAELLHGFPVWNWRALTVRAVAERSGVSERTVHRHFATERELRDAVLARLEDDAGIDLAGMRLEDLQEVTARIFEQVSRFPQVPRTQRDATVAAANLRQREALLAAVTPSTDGWPDDDRVAVAASLDVLWSAMSYERLVMDWGLEPQEATRAVTWLIGLVEDAIRRDHRPGS
jgi:AcrR family transcriptional regulator